MIFIHSEGGRVQHSNLEKLTDPEANTQELVSWHLLETHTNGGAPKEAKWLQRVKAVLTVREGVTYRVYLQQNVPIFYLIICYQLIDAARQLQGTDKRWRAANVTALTYKNQEEEKHCWILAVDKSSGLASTPLTSPMSITAWAEPERGSLALGLYLKDKEPKSVYYSWQERDIFEWDPRKTWEFCQHLGHTKLIMKQIQISHMKKLLLFIPGEPKPNLKNPSHRDHNLGSNSVSIMVKEKKEKLRKAGGIINKQFHQWIKSSTHFAQASRRPRGSPSPLMRPVQTKQSQRISEFPRSSSSNLSQSIFIGGR